MNIQGGKRKSTYLVFVSASHGSYFNKMGTFQTNVTPAGRGPSQGSSEGAGLRPAKVGCLLV